MTNTSYLETGYFAMLERQQADTDAYYLQLETQKIAPKGDFTVITVSLGEWIISTNKPMFYPDCDLCDILQEHYFESVEIDDECNLIVRLRDNCNSHVDYNYIVESFDDVLDNLPKYRQLEEALIQQSQAQANLNFANRLVEEARRQLAA